MKVMIQMCIWCPFFLSGTDWRSVGMTLGESKKKEKKMVYP